MANKDHTLDTPIITAAFHEFINNGYEKTSLRKIAAKANVTIGAIYTRYPTKNDLFYSLVEPLILNIEDIFQSLKEDYFKQPFEYSPQFLVEMLKKESDMILQLLFQHYDCAVLLLCKSSGSHLENFFDMIVERKIEETLTFFSKTNIKHPDDTVLRILIRGQFDMYSQIINEGYTLEDAKIILKEIMKYHIGGWLTLFEYSHQ